MVGKNGSVVTNYPYEKNIHSDSLFLQDTISQMEKVKDEIVLITDSGDNRAKSQGYMKSEEFSNYTRLRNGVETVPSNIRKNYHLNKLSRGKQRGKFFFGCKIAALNFRKLFEIGRAWVTML